MAFVTGLYDHDAFRAVFEPFVAGVAAIGDRIALGQVALKLTGPGTPDIYQGDELAFHALVDPDNRRPVDFEWRQAQLARLSGGAEPSGESVKLALTSRLLQLRIRRPDALGPTPPTRRWSPVTARSPTGAGGRGRSPSPSVLTASTPSCRARPAAGVT